MHYDRQLIISIGNGRRDLVWKQTKLTVEALYERLRIPIRGTETYQEYLAMNKTQRDALKDVGGFVGGALNGPRRKSGNVTGRDVITLDFDNIPGWQTEEVIKKVDALGCGYCVYSTRKHTAGAPRIRVILPLDRTVSPDEYEPCARRAAEKIGIGMADPTTFGLAQLMYWPSCCADSEYVYRTKDAPLLEADALLGTYTDWHNFREWPQVPNATNHQKMAMKQGDPLEKPGIVGAFCRTYDVYAAIDAFLPGVYESVDTEEDRYTYLGGSTTGGAVVYEGGKFLYSHHATDPCGGRLVNAFDLVRLHKFGEKDDDAAPDTPVNRLPSFRAMCDLALADKATVATLNREQQDAVARDFAGVQTENNTKTENTDWASRLKRNQNGAVKGTIDNILIILDGDPALKDKFALNRFADCGEVLGALPWERDGRRRLWDDTDSNGLYWYLELTWGITQRGNIDSALDVHASRHAFNEVQNYINGLEWDGTPRLDTLFVDYLGAQDTTYNRAVCRKAFTAAVARAMVPGCKYDNMLILSGPQGIGKSTLLDKMSRGWFNDSIRTFEGKDASELLQGVWLVEVSELDAFRRTDVARIKQFLSLRADRYRAAYGRHVKEIPRRCVFFGTTNTTDFLQDTTGNRRFWPVDVSGEHRLNVWDDLTTNVIDQMWAEAKVRWQCGEPLYLTGEVEAEARRKQEEHREISVREGMIQEFVNRRVPSDWQDWSLDRRRDFWAGQTRHPDGTEMVLVDRDRICALEIWCELFNGSAREIRQTDTRELNAILGNISGWIKYEHPLKCGPYARQRVFIKKDANPATNDSNTL